MLKKIYLIRHGETDYNKERRLQGWLDIPLNEAGHAQAQLAASKLKGHQLDALYSSDLSRAVETATYVAEVTQLQVTQNSALRETDMGIFAGWAWEKEPDPYKDELWREFEHARDNQLHDWNKHQGESIGEMLNRVRSFLDNLSRLHHGQNVGLVTHGGTINRILEYYNLKSSLDGFHMIGNASVIIITSSQDGYTSEIL